MAPDKDEDALRQAHAALSQRIRHHEHEYYILGQSSISDLVFDQLLESLRVMEQQYPWLSGPDSPLHRVGSDLSSDFPEVTHTTPVLSLDKAYDPEGILSWAERCAKDLGHPFTIVGERKMDGLSIVLYYKDGVFDKAVTRGNGVVGNDVSENVRTIREVPLRLQKPVSGAFRGEVYLRKDDFNRLNSTQEIPYANPRNLAGGTLRRVKSSEVAGVPLRVYMYEGFYDGSPADHWALLEEMKAMGFMVNQAVCKLDLPAQAEQLAAWMLAEQKSRPGLPYEIDGLVFKVNELQFREELGSTGHHPRWAIAYKFESPQGLTRVQRIDVQVGRTGRVTPVARVDGVSVGGATIQNVTLHNQDYINALELAPGDLVSVSRRGDVIPAIERVVEKGEASAAVWNMPELCPCCSSVLEREGAHQFCINFDCPDRAKGRLAFFCGRDQMDLEGFGTETIEVLWREGLVRDIPDLYSMNLDALLAVQGFGDKKIAILRQSLATSLTRPYHQLLYSLGIPELGPKVAELVIEAGYTSMDALFALHDRGQLENLASIKGIGPRTVQALEHELGNDRLKLMVQRLQSSGLCFVHRQAPIDGADALEQIFAGQVWCVTGSLEHFKPRERAMDEAKKRGARIAGDVSSQLTHLLAGEKAGSKLDKAKKLGIQIIDESTFLSLLATDKN